VAGTHSHKRETARRRPRAAFIAGPLAVLATGAAVSAGVAGSVPNSSFLAAAGTDTSSAGSGVSARGRELRDLPVLSRDSGDARGGDARGGDAPGPVAVASPVDKMLASEAVTDAINKADTELWTTTALNVWTRPDAEAKMVGEIESAEKVLITGRTLRGREEIVLDGKARWVTAGYLSAEKPFALGGDCTNGSTVASGVSPNIQLVHEAVCANFPEITSYGTFRSDGEHAQGIAVDIMVSGDRGWEVAEFVREHYSELGVSYVIYAQNIWSVDRSGEGWRGMEDRGSTTANHYDHVHVTTY
jgi:hypothetical protein